MADLTGGDAYFANTLRNGEWMSNDEHKRTVAVREAASMLMRLSFVRTPPAECMDGAIYEQAYHLMQHRNADAESAIAAGVRSRTVADASESYLSAAERDKDPGWINGVYYCPKALSWLSGYMGAPARCGVYRARGWEASL